jgi:hypothetical protein
VHSQHHIAAHEERAIADRDRGQSAAKPQVLRRRTRHDPLNQQTRLWQVEDSQQVIRDQLGAEAPPGRLALLQ